MWASDCSRSKQRLPLSERRERRLPDYDGLGAYSTVPGSKKAPHRGGPEACDNGTSSIRRSVNDFFENVFFVQK
jgi:hypothetical protein